jgi:hypothetical protein
LLSLPEGANAEKGDKTDSLWRITHVPNRQSPRCPQSPRHEEYRKEFLLTVSYVPFRFYTTTIVKARLSGKGWLKKAYMYQRAGVMTLDQALDSMLEATLTFDATSSRKVDREFLRFLKKHAGYDERLQVIKEIRRLESYKDDLVQLVDMVCGAVMADDDSYFRLIRHRQGGRVVFPPAE